MLWEMSNVKSLVRLLLLLPPHLWSLTSLHLSSFPPTKLSTHRTTGALYYRIRFSFSLYNIILFLSFWLLPHLILFSSIPLKTASFQIKSLYFTFTKQHKQKKKKTILNTLIGNTVALNLYLSVNTWK